MTNASIGANMQHKNADSFVVTCASLERYYGLWCEDSDLFRGLAVRSNRRRLCKESRSNRKTKYDRVTHGSNENEISHRRVLQQLH